MFAKLSRRHFPIAALLLGASAAAFLVACDKPKARGPRPAATPGSVETASAPVDEFPSAEPPAATTPPPRASADIAATPKEVVQVAVPGTPARAVPVEVRTTVPAETVRTTVPAKPVNPADFNPSTAPTNRQRVGLPQISIIDKMLAIEYALGPVLKRNDEEAWADVYRSTYRKFHAKATPTNLAQRRTVLALALGVKASDGVIALKGRDMEGLDACAVEIEQLANKLDVPKSYLERANIVRHNAKDRRWLEAFSQLGILQQQITKSFEMNPERQDDAVLVLVGSWLQGGRCMTDLLLENYTKQSSNILREPKIVAAIIQEFAKVDARYKGDPIVKEIAAFLPIAQKKVDVGIRDPILKEDIKVLNEGFTKLVDAILKPPTP